MRAFFYTITRVAFWPACRMLSNPVSNKDFEMLCYVQRVGINSAMTLVVLTNTLW